MPFHHQPVFFFNFLFNFSASLASLTRETGPKVVKGDPATPRKVDGQPSAHSFHYTSTPTFDDNISDSALKFTHVLYNLSPAGIYLSIHTKLIM